MSKDATEWNYAIFDGCPSEGATEWDDEICEDGPELGDCETAREAAVEILEWAMTQCEVGCGYDEGDIITVYVYGDGDAIVADVVGVVYGDGE